MAHVFISYVREDVAIVDRLAAELRSAGIDVWIDRERIKPGEPWPDAIRHAISTGAFFLACFSDNYVRREKSYANEELALAIEELRQRTWGRPWFIPVVLSKCEIPDRLLSGNRRIKDLQWVDLTQSWSTALGQIVTAVAGRPSDENQQPIISHSPFRAKCEAASSLNAFLSAPDTFKELVFPIKLLALLLDVSLTHFAEPSDASKPLHTGFERTTLAHMSAVLAPLQSICEALNVASRLTPNYFASLAEKDQDSFCEGDSSSVKTMIGQTREVRSIIEEIIRDGAIHERHCPKIRHAAQLLKSIEIWDWPVAQILAHHTVLINGAVASAMLVADELLQQHWGYVWRTKIEDLARLPDLHALIDPDLLHDILWNILSNVRFGLRHGIGPDDMPSIAVGIPKTLALNEGVAAVSNSSCISIKVLSAALSRLEPPKRGSTFDLHCRAVHEFGGALYLYELPDRTKICAELQLVSGEEFENTTSFLLG